jgi:hypothetical protein
MVTQFNATTLTRWTAALLAVSTLFFGLAVIVERSGTVHKVPVTGEQTGEAASGSNPTGESQEGNGHPEGAHTETTNEVVLGINLENPWIVWGFVGLSLLMIVAILRLGKRALLLTIPPASPCRARCHAHLWRDGRGHTPVARRLACHCERTL